MEHDPPNPSAPTPPPESAHAGPPRPDYRVGRTPVGHFLTPARDTIIGDALRNGHHFGREEVDRAVELVRRHRPEWRPGAFLDIGANMGTHIVYALRRHGFQGGLAFEIAAENYMLLRCNLVLNGFEPDLAVHCGLSAEAGTVVIEKSPFNNGDFRVDPARSPGDDGSAAGPARKPVADPARNRHCEERWQVETCTVRRFDDVVPEHLLDHDGTLAWIDTQGHETRVLQGARRLFERGIPFAMEFWPYGIVRSGSDFDTLWSLVDGCTVLDLRRDGMPVEPRPLRAYFDDCLRQEGNGYSPHTDLLVLP